MPIKPENRARYPKDWPEIRAAIGVRSRSSPLRPAHVVLQPLHAGFASVSMRCHF